MSTRNVVIVSTVLVWLGACAITAFVTVWADVHSDIPMDMYARHWDFQLMVFAITEFPFWLLALVIVVGAEALHFTLRSHCMEAEKPSTVCAPDKVL